MGCDGEWDMSVKQTLLPMFWELVLARLLSQCLAFQFAPMHSMQEVAEATGVVLDPVYSGKAIHGLLAEIKASPQAWQGRRWVVRLRGNLVHCGTGSAFQSLLACNKKVCFQHYCSDLLALARVLSPLLA